MMGVGPDAEFDTISGAARRASVVKLQVLGWSADITVK